MDTTLATNADAQLILKLYELRMETGLRAARKWVMLEFWPKTPGEMLNVLRAFGTEENAYLRQVVSYWEMAAALVLHGALNAALFLDCSQENLFIFSKFHGFLDEIHKEFPRFFVHTQELIEMFPAVRKRLEIIKERLEDGIGRAVKA